MRSLRLAVIIGFVVALATPWSAGAGMNQYGRATLSWSSSSESSNKPGTANPPGRLYVRLDSVQSVSGIDVRLAWTPIASARPEYQLTNWGAASSANCTNVLKGTVLTIPQATDSTLRLAATGSQASSCTSGVAMWAEFGMPPDSISAPGRFRLLMVTVVDATGASDVLTLGGAATIDSCDAEPAPSVNTLWPSTGWIGVSVPYRITGYNFQDSVTVRLARPGHQDKVGALTRHSVHSLDAEFVAFAQADTGYWDVVVMNAGGKYTTCPAPLLVSRELIPDLSFSRAAPNPLYSKASFGGIGSRSEVAAAHTAILKLKAPGPQSLNRSELEPADFQAEDPRLAESMLTSRVLTARCLAPILDSSVESHGPSGEATQDSKLVDFRSYYVLAFNSEFDRNRALGVLAESPSVEFITPNSVLSSLEAQLCLPSVLPSYPNVLYNDPNLNLAPPHQFGQWYQYLNNYGYGSGEAWENPIFGAYAVWRFNNDVHALEAAFANPAVAGNSNVTVGIIDSGVDTTHSDLNHSYTDASWGKKIRPGYNYLASNYDVFDDYGHGTEMAGIIAARANNGVSYVTQWGAELGIAGIAGGNGITPDSAGVRILPLKVLDDGGEGTLAEVADAINFAAAAGAKVINLSLGIRANVSPPLTEADPRLKPLRDALSNALIQGATCVAAMGNKASPVPYYPARFAEWGLCVAVGAAELCGERVYFPDQPGDSVGTAEGDWQDLLAPGYVMRTTVPISGPAVDRTGEAQYRDALWGSSYAAAVVSGVAAGLVSVEHSLTGSDVKALLRASSRNVFGGGGMPNQQVVNQRDALALIDPLGLMAMRSEVLMVPTVQAITNGVSLNLVAPEGTGLADGVVSADRYELRFRGRFDAGLAEPPLAWIRVDGTNVWGVDNPHVFNYGSGEVITETCISNVLSKT